MRQFLTFTFVILSTLIAFAQEGTVRGTLIDGTTEEPLMFASVAVEELGTGVNTDLDGAFSIDLSSGDYTLEFSYVGFESIKKEVAVKDGEVNVVGEIRMGENAEQLEIVVVTAEAIRSTERAIVALKKKSPGMLDGISKALIKQTGDANVAEAAKRVPGLSIEGGKYVYVRGLGDRYSKTTLNSVDIPGLDPDRNTIQMDIFPTSLLDNLIVSKSFTADMPADFTGGLMNVETKAFPEDKIMSASFSLGYNPAMNLNGDFLTYQGGNTDFLGFDDGTRALPSGADAEFAPTPISGHAGQDVLDFVSGFNRTMGAERKSSFLDYSAGISLGNQFQLGKSKADSPNRGTLGYIFSLSYRNDYTYYDDVFYGEYQRLADDSIYELEYANTQQGQIGEQNTLIGILGGIAYKKAASKLRLTATRLQNGESRAGQFGIDNNGSAVGQSGYIGIVDNLEYNQRSLTNVLLNGEHASKDGSWKLDWRLSPTLSTSSDPDIRRAGFSLTSSGRCYVNPGEVGNPTRLWRSLNEISTVGKADLTKTYQFRGENAKLKFGGQHTYKERDYEILQYNIAPTNQYPNFTDCHPDNFLAPENIFPNGSLYMQSGNTFPNPNQYNSTVSNSAFYISNEAKLLPDLNVIVGVRAENFVQHHTGRSQQGDNVLDNEKVLNALDLFPSANLIYTPLEDMNVRAAYSRTIARPSFKELSFAQIIDPVSNRIFNGGLFPYSDWDGNLVETRIDNFDVRWELFQEGGQLFSVSGFYKAFDKPIELVRIAEAQTSSEFQPRNVGDAQVYGVELEMRKNFGFIDTRFAGLGFNMNVTLVESQLEMTDAEFNARKTYQRAGEVIENTRAMAGQSPYVVNAGLTYRNPDAGWDAGLFYNVKGRTLETIGSGLYPDVYFKPFNSLNFSFNKRLGQENKTAIDFRVSNILNADLERVFSSFRAEDQLFSRFSPGMSFSLGISHQF